MKFFASLTLLLVLASPLAHGHPVAFQGAVGVMTWDQSFLTDEWLTYSFRPDMAVAARHMRFEVPEGRMQFYAPQFECPSAFRPKYNSAGVIILSAFLDH